MSTPTKFAMGNVPRTSTGLVPSSYRRQMDSLSSAQKWLELPSQPKPEMYPYRGDFVNERNRKLSSSRKMTKNHQKQSHPKERKKPENRLKPPNITAPQWDNYCQHISSTKLSDNERQANAQNKEKILAYIRSAATKRKRRAAMERKLQAELGGEGEWNTSEPANNATKQRKPPVPRLSHAARNGLKPKRSVKNSDEKCQETKTSNNHTTMKTKTRYLDFISNRADKQKSKPLDCGENTNLSMGDNLHTREETRNGDSDADFFRNKVELIVERAAAMVLRQSNVDVSTPHLEEMIKKSLMPTGGAIPNQPPLHAPRDIAENKMQFMNEHAQTIISRDAGLREVKHRLDDLEERIRIMNQRENSLNSDSTEVIGNETKQTFSSSSTDMSEVTFHSLRGAGFYHHGLRNLDDSNADDSHTEVLPRKQIYPMDIGIKSQRNTNTAWGVSTRPSLSSLITDETSTVETISVDSLEPKLAKVTTDNIRVQVLKSDVGLDVEEPKAVSFQPSPLPSRRVSSQEQHQSCVPYIHKPNTPPPTVANNLSSISVTQMHFDQPLPPCIEPSAIPTKHFLWEEEPLPRGHRSQSNNNGNELADDIMSLIG